MRFFRAGEWAARLSGFLPALALFGLDAALPGLDLLWWVGAVIAGASALLGVAFVMSDLAGLAGLFIIVAGVVIFFGAGLSPFLHVLGAAASVPLGLWVAAQALRAWRRRAARRLEAGGDLVARRVARAFLERRRPGRDQRRLLSLLARGRRDEALPLFRRVEGDGLGQKFVRMFQPVSDPEGVETIGHALREMRSDAEWLRIHEAADELARLGVAAGERPEDRAALERMYRALESASRGYVEEAQARRREAVEKTLDRLVRDGD